MSNVKIQAKKLKEIAQKYGYTLKHTHALEIVSQFLEGVNRHVALKNDQQNFDPFEDFFTIPRFQLPGGKEALKLPFGVRKHVIEILFFDETVDYFVTSSLGEMFEEIQSADTIYNAEILFKATAFRVLQEEDLSKQISFHNENNPELVDEKTIKEWIMEKHARTLLIYTQVIFLPSSLKNTNGITLRKTSKMRNAMKQSVMVFVTI